MLIVLGSLLAIAGWLLVFFMVIDLLTTTYLLSFFAYGIFMLGLSMGTVASYTYFKEHNQTKKRKKRLEKQWIYHGMEEEHNNEQF